MPSCCSCLQQEEEEEVLALQQQEEEEVLAMQQIQLPHNLEDTVHLHCLGGTHFRIDHCLLHTAKRLKKKEGLEG